MLMQIHFSQCWSVAWGRECKELALFNHSMIRYPFLLKEVNNYQTMPQKAEPDSSCSCASQLSHNRIYEVFSKATPLVSGILMSFFISVTLGLILDLEKSSLISFWHQYEFFTYMAKLLFSICTAYFSCSKAKGSKQSSCALRFFSSIDFNVITLSCLTCVALAELTTVS